MWIGLYTSAVSACASLTEWLRIHDEGVRAVGSSAVRVADLHQLGIALVLFTLAVTIFPPQQALYVAHLAADATAWHRLEVHTGAKRLCAQLLRTSKPQVQYKVKFIGI